MKKEEKMEMKPNSPKNVPSPKVDRGNTAEDSTKEAKKLEGEMEAQLHPKGMVLLLGYKDWYEFASKSLKTIIKFSEVYKGNNPQENGEAPI